MDRNPVDIETAIKNLKDRTRNIPPSMRPKKGMRPISSRTDEEAMALVRAIYYDRKKAEESGYLVKVPGGYRMQWR